MQQGQGACEPCATALSTAACEVRCLVLTADVLGTSPSLSAMGTWWRKDFADNVHQCTAPPSNSSTAASQPRPASQPSHPTCLLLALPAVEDLLQREVAHVLAERAPVTPHDVQTLGL
jgi:hypothetical protein